MVVERRAEAVQKGDAAELRAGGASIGGTRDACGSAQRPLDLIKSSRKIFVRAAMAPGRSASMLRSRLGTEITHCRTGTGGMT
jgi:hypothetical protein